MMICQRLFFIKILPRRVFGLHPKMMQPSISLIRRNYGEDKCFEEKSYDEHLASLIGNREMVGYGWNGTPCYYDRADFPFPSIRYKEPTPDLMALKEKERGDWRLLSVQDKKDLYRASYCQTFSEFQFPYSDWMAVVGYALMFFSSALWAFIIFHYFTYNPRPITFRAGRKQEALKRMIDLHVNPMNGLCSNWDYVRNDWKHHGILFGPPPNPFADEEADKKAKEKKHK